MYGSELEILQLYSFSDQISDCCLMSVKVNVFLKKIISQEYVSQSECIFKSILFLRNISVKVNVFIFFFYFSGMSQTTSY